MSATFTAEPSVAVIGTGAVGGYYGGRLAQHGREVHFLLRSDYAAVCKGGLSVSSPAGDFHLPPDQLRLYTNAAQMPQVDLVLVAIKTTANDFYEPLVSPLLKDNTAIITFQNGLGNEERLADLFGAERIMGCMAYTCINRIAPGKIHHVAHGFNHLGEFANKHPTRADKVAEIFRSSRLPCQVITDLPAGRWEKLAWNIPLNLSVLLDQMVDRILSTEMGVQVFREIAFEVLRIARSLGIALPDSLIDQHLQHAIQMGTYRTSMYVDREKQRPLEVEAIFGEPLRIAESQRISAPYLRTLYMLLKILDHPFKV